jgi:hypothetical protein
MQSTVEWGSYGKDTSSSVGKSRTFLTANDVVVGASYRGVCPHSGRAFRGEFLSRGRGLFHDFVFFRQVLKHGGVRIHGILKDVHVRRVFDVRDDSF